MEFWFFVYFINLNKNERNVVFRRCIKSIDLSGEDMVLGMMDRFEGDFSNIINDDICNYI